MLYTDNALSVFFIALSPQCENPPPRLPLGRIMGRMTSRRGSRRAHTSSFDATLADDAPAWTTPASALKQGNSDRAGYLTQAQRWALNDELLFCTVSDGHIYTTLCRVFLVHVFLKANVLILTLSHVQFRA